MAVSGSLQSLYLFIYYLVVRFEVFTAVTIKMPSPEMLFHGSYGSRRFGGKYRLHHQGDKNRKARNIVTEARCS
jgi:hypothetical protein